MVDDRAPLRLTPEMSSFRGLVLAFVRRYFADWGQSPSYGEIAASLGSNRTRVKRAVRSLAKAGLILHDPGPRGLRLPADHARSSAAVTKTTLLPPPALDYPAPAKGDNHASTDDKARAGRQRAAHAD